MSNYTIPGIGPISNTSELVGPDTRMCGLLWAASGRGKTSLAGSLHRLTEKHMGKPTLFCAIESGEGGGAIPIRDMNVPLWMPKDLNELRKGLAAFRNDKQFGGFVMDSATELVKAYIKPEALKFPCREKSPVVVGPRNEGVPTQGDYGTMGELCRQVFQSVINLSSHPDPSLRKHVIVTALDRMKEDSETHQMLFWGPDLPGAMASGAVGMFQLSTTIDIKSALKDGKRTVGRYLITGTEGVKSLKDRYKVFPQEVLLKDPSGQGEGEDLCSMWEKFWIPVIERRKNGNG